MDIPKYDIFKEDEENDQPQGPEVNIINSDIQNEERGRDVSMATTRDIHQSDMITSRKRDYDRNEGFVANDRTAAQKLNRKRHRSTTGDLAFGPIPPDQKAKKLTLSTGVSKMKQLTPRTREKSMFKHHDAHI